MTIMDQPNTTEITSDTLMDTPRWSELHLMDSQSMDHLVTTTLDNLWYDSMVSSYRVKSEEAVGRPEWSELQTPCRVSCRTGSMLRV